MGWFEAGSHVILCLLPSQVTYEVAIIIGTSEKSMYVPALLDSMSASNVSCYYFWRCVFVEDLAHHISLGQAKKGYEKYDNSGSGLI